MQIFYQNIKLTSTQTLKQISEYIKIKIQTVLHFFLVFSRSSYSLFQIKEQLLILSSCKFHLLTHISRTAEKDFIIIFQ